MRALIPQLIVSLALLPLACVADMAHPAQRKAVASIKPLLLSALKDGEAYGILTGKAHDAMRQIFKTDAPIEVDVIRISAHRQPGCARLSVTTRQAAVVLPAKKGMKPPSPHDLTMLYQIDYCSDGEFPAGER